MNVTKDIVEVRLGLRRQKLRILVHVLTPTSTQKYEMSAIANRRVVISKSYCPYSSASKQLLKELFPPEDILIFDLDLLEGGQAIQDYIGVKTGKKTVPQTFINGHYIGGNDDLQEAYKNGTLQRVVEGLPVRASKVHDNGRV
ncbi:thioredoxin-like protein [Pisolithus croceorrhizus]|nr:thioredoxin-like protein [Pisolithus croceorrhizus]KAI6161347.1 thioredoxin-like protein [Pisolithus thermaeus]